MLVMWIKRPFAEADDELDLSRFEGFESAYVHSGDIHVSGDWTGGHLLRACGHAPGGDRLDELAMFVIDGDLTVEGALDLDAGADQCIGLLVTGELRADIVDVDATLLFVFGGAEVRRLINFTTTDGTIFIAGTTRCPLVIYDEGNLDLDCTGHILCRGGTPQPDQRHDRLSVRPGAGGGRAAPGAVRRRTRHRHLPARS
ncbi:hypothetical protein AB0J63_40325 [Streptosporangium canum]|uniref:hypothetical protein n=1 Tax=Streptosporangium canum TaxID=324952 RepID=UPI0034456931